MAIHPSIAVIRKDPVALRVLPNLRDYEAACAGFSWTEARGALSGLPGGRGLNIAHEAVDRHAAGAAAGRVALRWLDRRGGREDISYADLRARTSRFANVLATLGVAPGERVFSLLGRVPALHVAAIGTLKRGAVFAPMFAAFGPEPVRTRLALGTGRVLVTTEAHYRKKVAPIRDQLPELRHVILVADDGAVSEVPDTLDFARLMAAASDRYAIAPTRPDDPALLHFTSGTTGVPKGALHVHEAILVHHVTGRLALDLHPEDVFWCTADPGWVTGTSYGILAPLSNGVTSIVDEGEFDAERWHAILREERVTVWYTAPTAVRMLRKLDRGLPPRHAPPDLRFIASVGEPLAPEAVMWGLEAFGLPIHDNWWQTETGGIMIANFAAQDIKPGSMGRPLPGIEAAVVRRRDDGTVALIREPDVAGELAIRAGWPSMFRTYLGAEERYRRCFADGWYLTGDLASVDADGYFWFKGRGDDVIKSMGHLIGPFEVESALMAHPAVAEAGVIGKPDPIAFEVVKAFVVTNPGYEPGELLHRELLAHARTRLGPAVAPKEIAFVAELPRTRSGKIMRRLLKARELGLPEGDLSTLEATP